VPASGDPSMGMVRATARVSSVAQPNPGEAVPVAKSSTVYGSSMASAAFAPADAPAPMAPPGRSGRPHAFGDLLEPAAPSNIPVQRGPQQPAHPTNATGAQAVGAPPAVPQRPGQPGPAGPPGDPAQSRFDQFAGAQGQQGQQGLQRQQAPARPAPASAPEQKPERKGRLIIGVLVGCALLLAVAFGGLLLIDKMVGPTFAVGDCVKPSENQREAVAASCSDNGAFKVVSSVTSADECDKTQPYVQIDKEILCLKPATAP
jgi:hypothetical protein